MIAYVEFPEIERNQFSVNLSLAFISKLKIALDGNCIELCRLCKTLHIITLKLMTVY